MPNSTFHNLSEEKKANILNVAYKIFANKRYEDVTIRDIVQEADIPIGSFYRYFKDKDDLYIYMLKLGENKIYNKLKGELGTSMILGSASVDLIKSVLTEEEYALDSTFSNASESLFSKYYFHEFNEDIEKEFQRNLLKLKDENKLREDIDFDFILHMYKTSMFNILMYFRQKNITSFDEKEQIKRKFFEEIFLKGITK